MKIAYVDVSVDGHHRSYIKALVENNGCDNIVILPERIDDIDCVQYTYSFVDLHNKRLIPFYKWSREIKKIVKSEQPDIVHFLYGDVFYKYFGLGLGGFRKYKTVLTMHWTKPHPLGMLSARAIASKIDNMIVHTDYIKTQFADHGIRNIEVIDYPAFNIEHIDKKKAAEYWGISTDVPTILCVGGTRYDKGLDVLLKALNKVRSPFRLLIAGKAYSFDEKFIKENAAGYIDNVTLKLEYLSDRELVCALNAADIIALPYRKIFSGASGPLAEGAYLKKVIIGPNHGSIGDIIRKNHLGYVFESENIDELAKTIEKALLRPFTYDETADRYRDSLSEGEFVKHYMEVYNRQGSMRI